LFTNTLPTLAQSGYLAKGCKIWLPNLQCIEDSLSDFAGELNPYFVIRREGSARENPLYRATENVEKELLMCPDALTNETQLRPLLNFSDKPFCVLELRDSLLVAPNTPTRKVAAVVSSSIKKRKDHIAALVETAAESKKTDDDLLFSPTHSKRRKVSGRAAVGRKLQLA